MASEEHNRNGWYEVDLWNHLEMAIQGYEDDRKQYWESRLESEEWTMLKQLRAEADEIAKLIRSRASALQHIGTQSDLNALYRVYHEELDRRRSLYAELEDELFARLPMKHAQELREHLRRGLNPDPEFLDADEPARLVWEALCIGDASEVVGSMRERVRRVLELERLVYGEASRTSPSAASLEFLALVSRCYVHGFDGECVSMCRSAIESAFRHVVTDDHCARSDRRPGRSGYGLDDRIHAAFHPDNNLLHGHPIQSATYSASQQVQTRGNKTIHNSPNVVKDVLGTIRSTIRVIGALSEL